MELASERTEAEQLADAWRVFVMIAGATLLASLNFSLMFVSFAELSKSFDASDAALSWVLTAFSITVTTMLIPAGWAADRYGRKRTFLVGFGLFTFGSGVVAIAPVLPVLIGGRVLQAAGLALESSASLAILLDAFPLNRRASAIGGIGLAGGAAATLGPVVGGAGIDLIGWRATIGLNVPLGILIVWRVSRRLPTDPPRTASAPPDMVALATLAVGIAALALAIVQIKTWSLFDARTLGSVALGVVALADVVRRSAHHPEPVLRLSLYRDRDFRLGSLLNLLIAGSFGGAYFSFVRLLTEGWGLSVFRAGLALAVITVFGSPLTFLAGWLADRHGHRVVIVPGAIVMVLACLLLAGRITEERNVLGVWVPAAAVFGTGVGFAHAACHASAMRTVVRAELGVAGAMSRICMEIGSVISVAVAVALVTAAGDAVAGTKRVVLLVAIVSAIGAVIATRLDSNQAPRTVPVIP